MVVGEPMWFSTKVTLMIYSKTTVQVNHERVMSCVLTAVASPFLFFSFLFHSYITWVVGILPPFISVRLKRGSVVHDHVIHRQNLGRNLGSQLVSGTIQVLSELGTHVKLQRFV